MLSKDVFKIYQQSLERLDEIIVPNISDAVMPFSDSSKFEVEQYIYTGEEKIPFNERNPDYQKIFKDEFL
jgi:hypothetical protein